MMMTDGVDISTFHTVLPIMVLVVCDAVLPCTPGQATRYAKHEALLQPVCKQPSEHRHGPEQREQYLV